MSNTSTPTSEFSTEIALIGLAGRFPGAPNLETFWRNLYAGVESIARLTDDELKASGVSPALFGLPNYVKAAPILDDIESFDAAFFGYSPREAELIDPQQRLFLECAWEALENAGYDPDTYPGAIGVFAGAKTSSYLLNLFANAERMQSLDLTEIGLGNDLANLTTRVSYKFNLKGPSYSVHTACSTSLVALHLACQSLIIDECQLALAGGVAVNVPHKIGYLYQPGNIFSPDGHCRPFDAKAQGTLFGSGVGVVVLKRLADALADSDTIYAVIKGTASNNDGSQKASFTAPGVEGQVRVIADALANALVDPAQISYVEAHGTGTLLGDSIEMRALTRAYRSKSLLPHSCAIGSVKGNIGHLDTAAGISSLIKTVLALQHKHLPPSINYEQSNPQIDFEASPFYVNTQAIEWKTNHGPRRAGVSSFGFGSANVHVILEEAPELEPLAASRPWQLLLLSAQSETALETATKNLVKHLRQSPQLNLADAAYTLQVGRRAFNRRRVVIARDVEEAAGLLATLEAQRVFTGFQELANRPIVFMFTGQGAQYPNMGLELYQTERVFRAAVDQCAELLRPHLGLDIRTALYPEAVRKDEAAEQLNQTALTQPALFVTEYALAQLWLAWGIQPQAMIGHSIGEYVAACLAGVFTLEEALEVIAARGRLMQSLPGGAMLAVSLDEAGVQPWLSADLSLAAVNGATLSVVSGPVEAVEQLQARLSKEGVSCRRLHTSHAFHSAMMEPIVGAFAEIVSKVQLKPPTIPFISNVTGTWAESAQVTDPAYWARHLRQPVRFAEGIRELTLEPARILLEVGPGQMLNTFARQLTDRTTGQLVLTSMRHPLEVQSDVAFLLTTLGRLWLAGAEIDWQGFYAGERRRRVALPTYPFERQRFWVEAQLGSAPLRLPGLADKKNDVADWFYVPSWKRTLPLASATPSLPDDPPRSWVIFLDTLGLGAEIVQRLQAAQQAVTQVSAGEAFQQVAEDQYVINPGCAEDYQSLFKSLYGGSRPPARLVHCWSLSPAGEMSFEWAQARGFYSLLYIAQALNSQNVADNLQLDVVSNQLCAISGDETLQPEKATLCGPCLVIPQEHPNLACRLIDLTAPEPGSDSVIGQLLAELAAPISETLVSYRGKHRWVQTFEPQRVKEVAPEKTRLRPGGVYLITGGLGEIGLIMAEALAQQVQAKLVLLGRSAFPARAEWEAWLADHDDQHPTSRRIRKLLDLEAKGSEILILSADVADASQMEKVVAEAANRFGPIHGVIHGAGLVGEKVFHPISETQPSQVVEQFQAKVHGLKVLTHVFQGKGLDFVVPVSSLTTVLGGLGAATYAAANAYMDALAQQHQSEATAWLSMNWDAWKLGKEEEQNQMLEAFVSRAITPAEGGEALLRALTFTTASQVVISTTDLQERISRWVRLESLRGNKDASGALHARPNLSVAYAAPRNEYEQNVAAIWQQVLGIEQVGIHDNFFDLGGHSLLITQLLNRLHKLYPVDVSMRDLFENPTVAGMGQVIERVCQAAGGQVKPIRERVREAAPAEQQALLETYLQQKVAQTLNLTAEQVAVNETLEAFGVELLIGDLQWNLQRDFRLQLYPHEIQRQTSLREMAAFVLNELNRLVAFKHIKATAPLAPYEQHESKVVAQAKPRHWSQPERRNESMVFLHGSPRSGSTLLRVMLAGHPALFCPPELDILRCEGMREWMGGLTDPTSAYGFFWATQGLEWAFVQLMGVDVESFRLYLNTMVHENVPTQEVYAKLQELASPQVLVDKTPQYSLRLETLLRAETLFEAPKYILLVRHPYSVIESLVRIRLDKLFGPVLYGSDQTDSHVVAEKVWVSCNQNLLDFSRQVGPERCHFIRYEDVVGDTRRTMAALCEFLTIPFDDCVLQPYDNKPERMITGIGDPNIMDHDRIDPQLGKAWQRIKLPYQLGEPARRLAAEFGYELPTEAEATPVGVGSGQSTN